MTVHLPMDRGRPSGDDVGRRNSHYWDYGRMAGLPRGRWRAYLILARRTALEGRAGHIYHRRWLPMQWGWPKVSPCGRCGLANGNAASWACWLFFYRLFRRPAAEQPLFSASDQMIWAFPAVQRRRHPDRPDVRPGAFTCRRSQEGSAAAQGQLGCASR